MEEIASVVLPKDIDEDSEVQSTSTDSRSSSNSVKSRDDTHHEHAFPDRLNTNSRDGGSQGTEPSNSRASIDPVTEIDGIIHMRPPRSFSPGTLGGRDHGEFELHGPPQNLGHLQPLVTGQDNLTPHKADQELQDDQSELGKDDMRRSFISRQVHFPREIENKPEKAVVKSLPTVRDHTTDQLTFEQDEYIPKEYDEAGERKVSPDGELPGKRQFRMQTFYLIGRGYKRFMLATECARILGYRHTYRDKSLFDKNRSLYRLIATQQETEDLVCQEILPISDRAGSVACVTAKSIFRQFGARVIEGGRRVRDDYFEAKAIKQGFTEEDMAGDETPGATKARDAAAAAEQSRMQAYDHTPWQDQCIPNQYGSPEEEEDDVNPLDLHAADIGRVNALGPPSPENPIVMFPSCSPSPTKQRYSFSPVSYIANQLLTARSAYLADSKSFRASADLS